MEWTKVLRGINNKIFDGSENVEYWFWHEQNWGIINNTGLHKTLRSCKKNIERAQQFALFINIIVSQHFFLSLLYLCCCLLRQLCFGKAVMNCCCFIIFLSFFYIFTAMATFQAKLQAKLFISKNINHPRLVNSGINLI